ARSADADGTDRGVLRGAQGQGRAGETAPVQRGVPRHWIAEAIELHPHAALHDELVQAVDAAGQRSAHVDREPIRSRSRIAMRRFVTLLVVCSLAATSVAGQQPATQVTAVRAGRLLDPEAGRILTNQIILVEGARIRDVGPNVAIPAGARTIDLSQMTVLPGLVAAHNHLALTYKPEPESNIYYYTYVQESTALRAIQAASNGIQMLASGFTIVRDMGNNALYADTALRQAIEQGWIPGPTIINSGII